MRYLILIVLGVFLEGCSTTIQVRREEPINNDRVFNLDQVNSRVAGIVATLVLRSGERIEAKQIRVGCDTTSFVDVDSSSQRTILTTELSSIRGKDHAAGAVSGLLIGMLSGLGTGVGVGLATRPGGGDSGMGAGLFAIGVTGLGTLTGLTIGGLVGSIQEYQLEQASLDSSEARSAP